MAGEPDDALRPLFSKLTPREAKEMGAERAAAHQRGRLIGALVAAVDEFGYGAVTVDMLVTLAGVSKSAFYRQFRDKEECFLVTFEEIVEQGMKRMEADSNRIEDPRERLRAAFEAFLALTAESGPAARLVFLASLEVGAAALAAREQASEIFRRLLLRSSGVPESHQSDVVIRAIVGGTHEVVYRRLRDNRPDRLRDEMEMLLGWGLGYRLVGEGSPSVGALLLDRIDGGEHAAAGEVGEELSNWADPLDSDRARELLSQRDRILRATAQVAVDEGFPRLSVAAISARAGTSNQTFYENFESKEEAFLLACDTLALRCYAVISAAFQAGEGRIEAGAAGMMAMLEHLARDTLYSRLAFVELTAAGREGRERAEAMFEVFIRFLEPATLPPELHRRPPRVELEAIGGGIWTVVRQEIVAGRGEHLPRLAQELIDFSLLPFGLG